MNNNEISFNWDIHRACNYNCPYCWFHGKWDEIKSGNVYHSAGELLRVWDNIYKKYGPVSVSITGGEPFLYPEFVAFIEQASQQHKFQIITNLSFDICGFAKRVNNNNVRVNPSFHPLSADVNEFIGKALFLKSAGLMDCITFLAWPPLIKKYQAYLDLFQKQGLFLTMQAFYGDFNGVRYPEGYTKEEKNIIFPQLGSRGGEKYRTDALRTMGRLCNAGKTYGVIQPDGKVQRCGGINGVESIVGNIFDPQFRLSDGPKSCSSEICPCNEWAFLLESKPAE